MSHGFCGLKCGDEVGLGDSSNLETRFVNDPSRDLCATVPMKVICQSFWTSRVLYITAFHRLRNCKDRA